MNCSRDLPPTPKSPPSGPIYCLLNINIKHSTWIKQENYSYGFQYSIVEYSLIYFHTVHTSHCTNYTFGSLLKVLWSQTSALPKCLLPRWFKEWGKYIIRIFTSILSYAKVPPPRIQYSFTQYYKVTSWGSKELYGYCKGSQPRRFLLWTADSNIRSQSDFLNVGRLKSNLLYGMKEKTATVWRQTSLKPLSLQRPSDLTNQRLDKVIQFAIQDGAIIDSKL